MAAVTCRRQLPEEGCGHIKPQADRVWKQVWVIHIWEGVVLHMHTPRQLLRQAWDAAAPWDEQHQVGAGAVCQDSHNEWLERLQEVGGAAGESPVLGLSRLPQTSWQW